MKRNRMILFALIFCFVIGMSIAGPTAQAHSKDGVFVVAPSGDMSGITDTANIQEALDAVSDAGKGTVLLEDGDFYICETLVGINFDGKFRGAGSGATVLHSIENFPAQDVADMGTANPRMLMFYQDDDSTSTAADPYKVQLCDFTILVDQPTEEWYYGYFRAMNTIDIYGKIVDGWNDEASYFDATCKDLEIIGDTGEEYGFFGLSIQNALLIQGQWGSDFPNEKISGNYLVEGCRFENSVGSSVMFGQFVDSHIRIVRNTYADTLIGPELYDLSNSQAEVAFNDISGIAWFGVYVMSGLSATSVDPSRVAIHHNNIVCGPGGTGIWIDEFLEGLSALVHHNEISMDDPNCMGIFAFGLQDSWFVRNTISGTGMAGIVTGVGDMFYGMQDYVSGWKMVLNDLSDFAADVAAIWLGPGTSDCWGLFKGDSSMLLDEGSNNLLHFI